ncbi:MAG: ABC transporter permease subunit [Thermoguttaceae bacterium]|jgi:NitT/TauT family transport system permease protein|nr:ABC transporter permease subunit [Thermoguttaceae bacterium]
MTEPTLQVRADRSSSRRPFAALRGEVPLWQAIVLGVAGLALVGAAWWWATSGAQPEDRWISPVVLPSPAETFADFDELWFDAALTRNILRTLRRVVLGFGLAAVVGVPVGVLCGCFRRIAAMVAPLTVWGRNAPIAAIIPLTFALFGYGEFQKAMFIFIACVAFVIVDTANAIADISDRYIDTAYTLGASRRQIILKVLVPLAMPRIFNSLRLLFGLAFGYIMLAEVVQTDNAYGLGGIINMAQGRGGHRTYILLILMIIPLVALGIDRLLYWVQRELFPYQYGGAGLLHRAVKAALCAWDDAKSFVLGRTARRDRP